MRPSSASRTSQSRNLQRTCQADTQTPRAAPCAPAPGGSFRDRNGAMIDSEDSRSRRCPKLGHEVTFRYCRQQECDRLCPRILTCWWEAFDVDEFLRKHVPADTMQELRAPRARPKVATLLELIEQAKKAQAEAQPSSSCDREHG